MLQLPAKLTTATHCCTGISKVDLHSLQMVQNFLARATTKFLVSEYHTHIVTRLNKITKDIMVHCYIPKACDSK